MQAKEDLEYGLDSFFAVGSPISQFFQRNVEVLCQWRLPDHPRHVSESRGDSAKRLMGEPAASHGLLPLAPHVLRNGVRIELGGRRGRSGRSSLAFGSVSISVPVPFRRGVGDASQQIEKGPDLLLTHSRSRGEFVEPRLQQIVQRPPQQGERKTPIGR